MPPPPYKILDPPMQGMDNLLLLFIRCGANQAYRRVPWSSVVHLGGRRVLLSLGGTTSLSNDCMVSINDSDRVKARSRRSMKVGFHKYPPIVRMLNRLCNKSVTYQNCVFLSSCSPPPQFPPSTPVSSTRKPISPSFHCLDMTLAVAGALNPN